MAKAGLANDGEEVTVAADRKTAVQKKILLQRMLGLIAQFSPSVLRNDIIKRSISLDLAAHTQALQLCSIRGSFLKSCIYQT